MTDLHHLHTLQPDHLLSLRCRQVGALVSRPPLDPMFIIQ